MYLVHFWPDTDKVLLIFFFSYIQIFAGYGEENIHIQIEYSSCVILKTNSSNIVGPKQAINSFWVLGFVWMAKEILRKECKRKDWE